MIGPVSASIESQGEFLHAILVDLVVQGEKNAEAGLCENGVCGSGKNVVAGEGFSGVGEPLRRQLFFHREVRKLYHR